MDGGFTVKLMATRGVMVVGAGYYEHQIEVRFNEGLLSSSSDWQWFVDCTEDNFASSNDVTSFDDFLHAFSSVQSVYAHLARIVDLIGDFQLSCRSSWLSIFMIAFWLEAG